MCGIVGIVSFNPREYVDVDRLRSMRDVLRHRGPDGEGLFVDGPVGLGHRRLAIIDVAGGSQPMANEDSSAWIVFNGEIYNHGRLRPGLEAQGHHYKTRSDTETILHLYEEQGERCVEALQGMFAFAIWDRTRQRLLLARDRLGIKPLYYALTDRELLFASEIKGILAAGSVTACLDENVLPEFLATGFVSGEETFFRGIRRLQPGRTLSWSPGERISERRYWQLPAQVEQTGGSIDQRAEEVRARLATAVRSHLMSDVPLGLFLSGGVDSSGLAALMAPMVPDAIRTFAVGFSDREANELAYARLAARAVGAIHHEMVVTPEEFFAALPRLVWHEDEPMSFAASVPLYFLSSLAREHVKVVLTGEGADELFLGYERYRLTAWNERLGRIYWRVCPRSLGREVSRFAKALPRPIRRYTERSFLAVPPGPRSSFCENFAPFPEVFQGRLLADPTLLTRRDLYAKVLECYGEACGGPLERMSHADLQTYLVRLLMKQDQMSMAASIESRVPFLDHELVEYAAAMPGRFKLRGLETKAVLKAALRNEVPPPILSRRKMAFPVPIGRWLRGPYWPIVEEFILGPRALRRGLFNPSVLRQLTEEHRNGQADHRYRLWLLLNLEIWQRVFIDREDTAAIMKAA